MLKFAALGKQFVDHLLVCTPSSTLQEPATDGKKKPAAGVKKAAAPGKADGKAAAAKAADKPAAKKKAEGASQGSSTGATVKREKKVYDLPGQTRDTPAEVCCMGQLVSCRALLALLFWPMYP